MQPFEALLMRFWQAGSGMQGIETTTTEDNIQ